MTSPFRIGFVPGATPDKWIRRWRERRPDPIEVEMVAEDEQRAALDAAQVHMCLVRLPLDREGLHLIPLYVEDQVVVLSTEHELSLLDELSRTDLDGEIVHESVHAGDVRPAIETAAAGTGVVVVPRSVARLHHRRDLTVRRLADAAGSQVGLAWRRDLDDSRADAFVGIVRGRTERSSRG